MTFYDTTLSSPNIYYSISISAAAQKFTRLKAPQYLNLQIAKDVANNKNSRLFEARVS
jgi:hypothetical protein